MPEMRRCNRCGNPLPSDAPEGACPACMLRAGPEPDTMPSPDRSAGEDVTFGDLAVKVLLESHEDKPERVRRFVEEAQIGGQLQHPGIVRVYERGAKVIERGIVAVVLTTEFP